MEKALKRTLIFTGVAGILGFAGAGLYRLFRAGSELSVRIANIKNLDVVGGLTGYVRFDTDIQLLNHAANTTLKIRIPSIKILYKEDEIGYTVPVDAKITLAPQASDYLRDIRFNIPVASIPLKSIAQSLLQLNPQAFIKDLALKLDLRVNGLPLTIIEPVVEPEEEENVGLVAMESRKIRSGAEYERFFPEKPRRSDPIIVRDGNIDRTIRMMMWVISTCSEDTANVARVLRKSTLPATLSAVYGFAYDHFRYRRDDPGVEQLRRPLRSWYDRQRGIDCDDFTILIGSILQNLGIRFYLRITKYSKPEFQHVYIVVPAQQWPVRNTSAINTYAQ